MAHPQHFLLVTFPGQGHINPSRGLAKRLAHATGAAVTLSTAVSAHRRMFPSIAAPDQAVEDGPICYAPYTDGFDDGFVWSVGDPEEYMDKFLHMGRKSLGSILDGMAARGRPVTCIIYSIFMFWVGDVADEHGIPASVYWIQPTAILAIYYHYFHGYKDAISAHAHQPSFTVNMPELPPLAIRDLPNFFTNPTEPTSAAILDMVQKTVESMEGREGGGKRKVLVNTFELLEEGALKSVQHLDVVPIGPMIPSLYRSQGAVEANSGSDLFKRDEKGYMEWLDTKPEKSVVYVSFGSISAIKKRQMEEIAEGLRASGRPYLWVLLKNNREELGVEVEETGEDQGMVVEWCDQVRVLSHPAVGCFVTHCGWNSTLESLSCGVPMVGVPQWTDQDTNARMVEGWGAGVRADVDGERVVGGKELRRCVEAAMGSGEQGAAIRRSSKMWSEKAREAVGAGGSSDRNLAAFIAEIGGDEWSR